MKAHTLLALTLCLSAVVLWMGSSGSALADDGSRSEVLLAQFAAEEDDGEAAEGEGDDDHAEGEGEAVEGEGDDPVSYTHLRAHET